VAGGRVGGWWRRSSSAAPSPPGRPSTGADRLTSPANQAERPLGFDARDWSFHSVWVDASGHEVSSTDVARLISPDLNPAAAGHQWYEVLQQNGIHYSTLVQPYQRGGTFQLIEAGIFLALIAICGILAFWRVRRRTV